MSRAADYLAFIMKLISALKEEVCSLFSLIVYLSLTTHCRKRLRAALWEEK